MDVDWLKNHQFDPKIKILDGTWVLAGGEGDLPSGVIPNAKCFDLGYLKSKSKLGEAYPLPQLVQKTISGLCIENDDHLIVYDRQGLFSAPRVAWSLLTIGHSNISVLNGGLPQWLEDGNDVVKSHTKRTEQTDYQTNPSLVKGVTIEEVIAAIGSEVQIIDARSAGRFAGKTPEPRPNLRSGHIPSSLCLPLATVKSSTGKLLEDADLRAVISAAGIDMNRPIITTCGSGVTAAALAFIFYALGKEDVAVYTGSWAEYGASEHPIETDR